MFQGEAARSKPAAMSTNCGTSIQKLIRTQKTYTCFIVLALKDAMRLRERYELCAIRVHNENQSIALY